MKVEEETKAFVLPQGVADVVQTAKHVDDMAGKDGVDGLVDAVEAADLQVHHRFLHWMEQVRRLQLTMVGEMSDDVRVSCRKMALAANPREIVSAQAELFQNGMRRAGTAQRDAWTAWTEMHRLLVDDLRVNARLVAYACLATQRASPAAARGRGHGAGQARPAAPAALPFTRS